MPDVSEWGVYLWRGDRSLMQKGVGGEFGSEPIIKRMGVMEKEGFGGLTSQFASSNTLLRLAEPILILNNLSTPPTFSKSKS